MNPSAGKRQIVDPDGERIDGYVTVPGDSMFKVAADG